MKILSLGGDRRMEHAAKYLNADLLPVGKYPVIVLPLPLTKDKTTIFSPDSKQALPFFEIEKFAEKGALVFAGGSCENLENICDKNGYVLIDYFKSEPLTLKNAALTAEAAAALLSQSSEAALLGSKALITGFGRIARFLSRELAAFGCLVTIAARSPAARAEAALAGFSSVSFEELDNISDNFDYLVNTVPAHVLCEEIFKNDPSAVYLELASLENYPEKTLCEKHGLKYIPASGLPGKYSPKTAGKFIADEIKTFLKSING